MKQIIIINRSLNMRRGKEIAQGAHASLGAVGVTRKKDVETWKKFGSKKICLQAADDTELQKLHSICSQLGLPVYLVHDFGLTEIAPNSITALAIGPCEDFEVDPLTEGFKLY